jgi:hypothetical protein
LWIDYQAATEEYNRLATQVPLSRDAQDWAGSDAAQFAYPIAEHGGDPWRPPTAQPAPPAHRPDTVATPAPGQHPSARDQEDTARDEIMRARHDLRRAHPDMDAEQLNAEAGRHVARAVDQQHAHSSRQDEPSAVSSPTAQEEPDASHRAEAEQARQPDSTPDSAPPRQRAAERRADQPESTEQRVARENATVQDAAVQDATLVGATTALILATNSVERIQRVLAAEQAAQQRDRAWRVARWHDADRAADEHQLAADHTPDRHAGSGGVSR